MTTSILSNPDSLISSVTGAFVLAASAVWIKGASLVNLKRAQDDAINGIASENINKELVEVIEKITREEPRLLMPPRRNYFFLSVSITVIVLGAISIFHDSLSKTYPNLDGYIMGVIALYIGTLVFGFYLVIGEYRFLAAVEDWKKRFNENGASKKRIICSIAIDK